MDGEPPWAPLGDEGLFSEQQEKISFLNVFQGSNLRAGFSPHTSEFVDVWESEALVKISWSFDATLPVLVENQELYRICSTIWGIFLHGVPWRHKVFTRPNQRNHLKETWAVLVLFSLEQSKIRTFPRPAVCKPSPVRTGREVSAEESVLAEQAEGR